MESQKILVVDDDPAIRNLVHRYLSQQNYQVESAEDGATALVLFKEFQPDLVVLDMDLPDTNGFQLCQEMKSYNDVFVLMLRNLDDETTTYKIDYFCAHDYLRKPFALVELGARIRANLNRQRPDPPKKSEQLIFGDLVIDSTTREAKFQNKIIPLTHIQFNLLSCMASKPGYAWKRSELYNKVWDSEWVGDLKCSDVHVGQIRKKLRESGCDFEYITTVWKVGYKFMESQKILVVDDDPAIRNLVHRYLSQQNYQVESAEDGATALVLFKEFQPDLVILDNDLPDTTGFQLYDEMKSYNEMNSYNYVFGLIMVSLDHRPGYGWIGPDYITKPFSLVEIGARIRANLNRQRPDPRKKLEQLIFGDLFIDSTTKEAKFQNKIIPLTHIEFNLLFFMASKPGYAWKRSQLCNKIWGSDWVGDPKCISVHVDQIRKKLRESGCDFEYITTVWKVGYKFEAPVENDSLEE
ncbi:response regulator transcription factor [Dapis sp. BLCC M172]|uniref:response regulator transcription factor n=1 Tax=Dapis sp. BLCC M172 TaxID=2975281 RepID=UPI003CE797D7